MKNYNHRNTETYFADLHVQNVGSSNIEQF